MNKKSMIGMVLLVAMVLAKAFLFEYEDVSNDFTARNESELSEVNSLVDLRSSSETSNFSSNTDLIAANLISPNVSDFEIVFNDVEVAQPESDLNDLVDLEETEEIIPMDYVSNTGYGRWRNTPSEEKTAPQKENFGIEGKVPLDGRNTITDNISKLFPRVP